MSAEVMDAKAGTRTRTGAVARLAALGRAELTLLARNKTVMFMALAMPIGMAFAMRQAVRQMPLTDTGLTVGTVLLPATIGFVLIFGVYSGLTGTFVARREELVLKRLRCGELTDPEILAGTALPTVAIGLAQCVLLAACGGLLLDADPPHAPHLLLAGVVIGMVLAVGLAAASASFAKTTDSAQLTVMPLMMLSCGGSGMIVPLDIMPDQVARVLELLPMSPVIALVREGWTGGAGAGDVLKQLAIGLVWTGLTVLAVRRRFRWEPRR
ncbi:ABC transporter permease [Streptomyces sp. MST-110588]|uniref:ABC transporter permease n=1 Tax=Streptomyces sp. MST-110588 TaxID=2833628 RepID=UPI001F5E0070|nr:ABC transporter permease [Streptomyces sp. MST-110588]UNO41173.1 ABC transporter permease [Streptomyces sp. MST-110588]